MKVEMKLPSKTKHDKIKRKTEQHFFYYIQYAEYICDSSTPGDDPMQTSFEHCCNSQGGDDQDILSLGHETMQSTYPEYGGYTFVRNVCNHLPH
jgi:hypothetical protein